MDSNGVEVTSANRTKAAPVAPEEKHTAILALAPNGAYKQKSDHPGLPLSLDEIVQTAVEAQQAGASLLHLHIRDKNGLHSLDPIIYKRTIDAIKGQLDHRLIIQITSEAAGQFSPEQQIACIRAVNAECVSIALREIVPDKTNLPAAQALFDWCATHQSRPQFILYSEFELLSYLEYCKQGIIPSAPHSVLFVLGRYAQGQESTEADLAPFLRHNGQVDAPWMVCAFGSSEQKCLLYAAGKGGHMRLGFENNLLNAHGHVANSNTEQLQGIMREARNMNWRFANSQQAREILAIRQA
jgi:3-keto-5-aminohexanoate cleavage enzyme